MQSTNEFSFMLKPGEHGIGVFALHDIDKGVELRLFGDTDPVRVLNKKDIPEELRHLCADRGDTMICPTDFGHIPLGWYLNHSSTPNTEHNGSIGPRYPHWFAMRDIKAGEEITIDYNTLDEPEENKEAFYLADAS
jgi:SET domain-containing protein